MPNLGRLGLGLSAPRGSAVFRRNYALWSEAWDNAVYTNLASPSVTADTAVAPDSTTTADTIVLGLGGGIREQPVSIGSAVASRTFTVSAYIKIASGSAASVMLKITHPSVLDYFGPALALSASWARFSFTQALGAGAGSTINCGLRNTGAGDATLHVWGLQVEEGPDASGYTKTTTVPAP